MEVITRRRAIACMAAAALLPRAGFAGAASLYADAVQVAIDRGIPSSSVSYLLLDAHSGAVVACRWKAPQQAVAIGSLIKPFTALAYAQGGQPYPIVLCRGAEDRCWLPQGHGRLALEQAVAQSCNAYFLALARQITAEQANRTLSLYDLPTVTNSDTRLALAGLDDGWVVSPLIVARAYARMAYDLRSTGSTAILQAMRKSASEGTARALHSALPETAMLAKTGTARCSHAPRATADGFVVVLCPAEDPRQVLLTRVHGVTGSVAAVTAAQILGILQFQTEPQ